MDGALGSMNSQDKQEGEWYPQESKSIASVTGEKVGTNMMTEAKGREEVVMVNAITQLCREGLRSSISNQCMTLLKAISEMRVAWAGHS